MRTSAKKLLALSVILAVTAAALFIGRQGIRAEKSGPGEPALHWVFDKTSVNGSSVTERAGSTKGVVRGGATVSELPALEIHSIDGGFLASERKAPWRDSLPEEAFTVTAWARIDRTARQGALLCLLKGRAEFRKGLFLGYNHQHFNFGLSTTDADDGYGKFTVLQAKNSYMPGRWYFVAATYEGSVMRLYVNRELVGQSRAQSGKVQAPATPLWLGRYQDDETGTALDGALREVALFK